MPKIFCENRLSKNNKCLIQLKTWINILKYSLYITIKLKCQLVKTEKIKIVF